MYLNYFGILQNLTWNYEILQKFMKVNESYRNSTNIRQHLTGFKWFLQYLPKIFWYFTEFNEKLWDFTKVNETYDIPWYFLCIITHFHSVLFNCNALLAFCDFVLWQTKFFCLLLYSFAFRQHLKYFTIVKWKVIHQISQILKTLD